MALTKNLINKNILKLILAIFVIELFSLISFEFAWLSAIFFIIISIGVLLFTLYKLEYGLLIALAELMIGSYGYLFYLELPGFKMPIRLAIFLIVFFVWLFKNFNWQKYFELIKKSRLWQSFILFLVFVALGVINGILHKNGLKNIFFDFNAYLYFGLFPVFLEVFKNEKQIINFLKILLAALIYVSLKIFATLYIFTHGFENLTNFIYIWIRDTRVGEITYAGGNFFRIFFQSQIWSLIGIFVIVSLLLSVISLSSDLQITFSAKKRMFIWLFILLIAIETYILILFPLFFWHSVVAIVLLLLIIIIQKIVFQITPSDEKRRFIWLLLLLVSTETSILISFSRSFWLGGIAGFVALFVYLIFSQKLKFKKIVQIIGLVLSSLILSVVLMLIIINFPIPKPSGAFTAFMLAERFKLGGEAAVSSRWNLLPVLINKIKQSPILGTGFGTTMTYKTEDPRIKNEANPEGWYTTYTFEWGYLDIIIKIGILGLLAYLIFIGQIFYLGIKSLKYQNFKWLNAGFLIGLIVLLFTHAFSPYLNHPLGIGYLMLTASIFQALRLDRNK